MLVSSLTYVKFSLVIPSQNNIYNLSIKPISSAAGKYSSTGATSSATCDDCAAGKYSSSTGSSSCDACAAGKYSSFTGATSSEYGILCEEGKASKYEGANSIEFCEDIEEEISGAGSLFGVSGCAATFWVTVVSVVVYVW